jgi:hypothetical protein
MNIMEWLLMRDTRLLAERMRASDAIRRRARENRSDVVRDLAAEIDWLRLLTASLAELLLEKGVVTEDELRARLAKLDSADGASDGKLAPGATPPASTPPKGVARRRRS